MKKRNADTSVHGGTHWSHLPWCENSPAVENHLRRGGQAKVNVPEDLAPGELYSIMPPDLSSSELHESNWSALSEPLC